jgi:hypothetical protein
LNLEDSEVIIVLIKLFKSSCVDLILELGDTKVLDLDWVCDIPLDSYWYWWKIVGVL